MAWSKSCGPAPRESFLQERRPQCHFVLLATAREALKIRQTRNLEYECAFSRSGTHDKDKTLSIALCGIVSMKTVTDFKIHARLKSLTELAVASQSSDIGTGGGGTVGGRTPNAGSVERGGPDPLQSYMSDCRGPRLAESWGRKQDGRKFIEEDRLGRSLVGRWLHDLTGRIRRSQRQNQHRVRIVVKVVNATLGRSKVPSSTEGSISRTRAAPVRLT